MNILIVTQYFYPENFKSNDLAFELHRRGHKVTVLTGLPNYPAGKVYDGYGIFKNRTQIIQGVTVVRSLLIPRGKSSGFRLMLNYFSFAFFASIKALSLASKNKYDVIIVHEPSPVTQFIPALVFNKLHRTPIYFWVLDLWPESLRVAGNINNKYILNFFKTMTTYFYKKSEKILIGSEGFKKSILEKGDFEEKMIYFPNWAEEIISKGDKNYSIPKLPSGFKVLFAGNMGESQDIDNLLKAALLLKNSSQVKLIIIGDGRKTPFAKEFVRANNLENNVFILGRFPIEAMASFFDKANALIFSLKDDEIFNYTLPSKVQAYLSSGKPIIGMINGEGNRLINKIDCGYAVEAGDFKSLAAKIMKLSTEDEVRLNTMSKNGQNYYKLNFTLKKCMDNLEKIIKSEI